MVIEPESLARRAHVNRELVSEAASQLPVLHFFGAIGADHKRLPARRDDFPLASQRPPEIGLSIAEGVDEAVGLRRRACSVAK